MSAPTPNPLFDTSDLTEEERSLTGHAYDAEADGSLRTSMTGDERSLGEKITLGFFVGIPLLAVFAAIPVAWGWGIGWSELIIGLVFYTVAAHGITIGYHRYFTHGSFKAKRPLKIMLALTGSLAIQGPVVRWVADHRKHHAYSDRDGDPHSPWRYGEGVWALTKGLLWAHVGWLFDTEKTPADKYAPDLIADPDVRKVSRFFPLLVVVSLVGPAVIGGLVTWSWWGALTAFFWAGLVRIGLVHHVTWSVNSICHVFGRHPFKTRDHAGNVAWMAPVSGGESWHNLHHSDPVAAQHGVLRWQMDTSASMIALFECFGWAYDVRWPRPDRLEQRRTGEPGSEKPFSRTLRRRSARAEKLRIAQRDAARARLQAEREAKAALAPEVESESHD